MTDRSPELTDEVRQQLRDTAFRNLQGFIRGEVGDTLGGVPVPTWLAGPAPTTPLSLWQWRAGRRICDRWAGGNRASILPGRDIFYRNLCTPYIEQNHGPIPPGQVRPPVPGGQCPCRVYLVTLETNFFPTGGQWLPTMEVPFFGPIGAPFYRLMGPRGASVQRHLGLLPSRGRARSGDVCQPPGNYVFTDSSLTVGARIRLRSIRPTPAEEVGGGCGNGSPIYDPGEGPAIPRDPNPLPPPPGFPWPGIQVDVDLNPDGTIRIDFGADQPPRTIDPDEPRGLPPAAPQGPPPGDQGSPGGSATAEGESAAEGEAPPGRVLVGLRVDILRIPPSAKEYAPGVYRAVCWIYTGGVQGLDQDFGGANVTDGQFFYAEAENATRWRVIANVGWRLRVTPFFREADT